MDNTCSIPDWNERGLLPPIRQGGLATSFDRSPYRTDIVSFVEHFAGSQDRIIILEGFLKYRGLLRENGIVSGIQWINGSFVENVEMSRKRSPHDIDVVTFFDIPEGESQLSLLRKAPCLCEHDFIKQQYHVDGYLQSFGSTAQQKIRAGITYWYSMWSHTRNKEWKGFIEISLDTDQDAEAMEMLENMRKEAGDDQ